MCECTYLKKTLCESAIYGMGKAATMDITKTKSKKSKDGVLTEKVGKSEWKKELFTSVGAYALSQYGYWYLKDGMMSYEPTVFQGLPIDVVKDVYQAFIIEMVNGIMKGKFSMNSFLHELLLTGGADIVYNQIGKMGQ